MAGSSISTLSLGASGGAIAPTMLEQFDFKGTNTITSGSGLFTSCRSLKKIVELHKNLLAFIRKGTDSVLKKYRLFFRKTA